MGKLVLFLADGSTHQVVLDKERITIGRRADNDVCLPHPAVSGEHATVTTILTDSFLEDQGSTNGTLVNGRPIAKHFLRDRDVIDIGRQRMVYMADNEAVVEPMSEAALHREIPGLTDRVPRAEPRVRGPSRESGRLPAASVEGPASAKSTPPGLPARTETSRYDDILLGSANPLPPPSPPPMALVPTPMLQPEALVPALAAPHSRESASKKRAAPRLEPTVSPASASPSTLGEVDGNWTVNVLTGPSKGRTLALTKPEMVLGRVGVQVAAIRLSYGELRLVQLEGTRRILLNGGEIPMEGAVLQSGDVFDVAGTRLELRRK